MIDGAVVFGRNGQVARSFAELVPTARFIGSAECDFNQPELVAPILDRLKPRLVINASAYTEVDKAETEVDRARRINGDAPGELAKWCARHEVPLIHYSTDYVYSGEGTTPWRETDPVSPLSSYGLSKLAGEEAIRSAGAQAYILRTSWVYSAHGKNFLKTMLALGKDREHLRIVGDQVGAPTYALDLARFTLAMIAGPRFRDSMGTYNLCNTGETNWHGFALKIFEVARAQGEALKVKQVDKITSAEYPTPAKRPLNSRMNTDRFVQTFGVNLTAWDEAVERCVRQLLSIS